MKRDKKGRFEKGYTYRQKKPHWDYDWLYEMYVVKKLSTTEIAELTKTNYRTISFWMKKHNIKGRTISESRKIKYWGSVGSDNPMWNKRGELNKNWKGGITPERQSFYTSQEWKDACKNVWKRDKAICQRCGEKKGTDIPFNIHHIVSFSDKKLRACINNLILVCEPCHQWIHSRKNINKEFLKNE